MKFEHLVEINNPNDLRIQPLTRLQLWRGLVLRTEQPTLFIPHLDSCTIVERAVNTISRCLDFGTLIVNDHVHYTVQNKVRFDIPEQGEIVASTLEMTIEEPQPDRLFVRFTYEDTSPEYGPEAFYNDFRRSAYREADIDTIRIIRQMAAEGRFNGPPEEDEQPA
ncbi:DUF1857 family protein [Oxalobacter sp. OttesenSCG-928-P03]|nr:DUF1857 family protein [Oxalobacter sp. OttesenSCG-928-P03]